MAMIQSTSSGHRYNSDMHHNKEEKWFDGGFKFDGFKK